MDTKELERYLHEHIPLSRAMGVAVVEATYEEVRLSAPLAPNINHRETVFGGSASAVAILAAWTLLHVRLQQDGLGSRVVIQRNEMSYEHPIIGTFYASSSAPDPAAWERFVHILKRKGRARIAAGAVLQYNDEKAGELHGEFVAIRA